MTETNKIKQNIALVSFCLACFLSFAAVGALIGLHLFDKEPVEQHVETVLVQPLIAEPERLDFGEVDEGTYEGIVHLVNQTDRPITTSFCR